jgi:hypothetical protein
MVGKNTVHRYAGIAWVAWVAVVALGSARAATAQGLADFDYENLSFRGIGLEAGWIMPTKVESTGAYGVRIDMGYLGPGLRITPSFTYWSSELDAEEVDRLEGRVAELIADQGGGEVMVDLGVIEWSDLVLGFDGHFVWSVPFGFLTYAGAGASAHILNGSGSAIDGTFVEDLLDSVTAGINLHVGLEYPFNDRFRAYGQTRYEVLGDFQYLDAKVGIQIMFSGPEVGERR